MCKTVKRMQSDNIRPQHRFGVKDYQCTDMVQNRSLPYFLVVHRFAPKLAINGDVGWMASKMRR